MTIFIIDNDPQKIAEQLDDRTLDKMIKEIAQVLCNVHHEILQDRYDVGSNRCVEEMELYFEDKSKIPLSYKKVSRWTQWASECRANYLWLVRLGFSCCVEYFFRFTKAFEGKPIPKIHKYEEILEWTRENIPDLPGAFNTELNRVTKVFTTSFPLVMPEHFIKDAMGISPNYKVIESYRNYYNHKLQKAKVAPKWTRREKPEWVEI